MWVAVIALALFQFVYVWLYGRRSRLLPRPRNAAPNPSPASVILCVRGNDPTLDRCLERLAQQDYPDYEVLVVVDSDADPAAPTIRQWCEAAPPSGPLRRWVALGPAGDSGSRKCQALRKGLGSLRDSSEFLALVDADGVIPFDWLTRLLEPFSDPTVGATHGNRCFCPPDRRLGSHLRAVWNLAAVVQMAQYGIAWGGSLAFRLSTLRESGMVERWKVAFCEDTMVSAGLRNTDTRLVRIADLVIPNPETTSLPAACHWIVRQLTTSRLYVAQWPLVLAHGIGVGIANLVCLVVAAILASRSDWRGLASVALAWILLQAINYLLLSVIDAIQKRSVPPSDCPPAAAGSTLPRLVAILLAQLVQPWAACHAHFLQRIRWRDVRYRIRTGPTIEIESWEPMRAEPIPNPESID